ncbi:hypothetical protein HNQ96_003648 [Aminobacter lissarensis]|uniref:Uncharacterized protein n=1 Tax=Aminobacter carboxidus TaxID=376165 RepID=A0A8E1WI22_9HYPH|nr:hypothetical protein [Aminobacter lissarensis]
MAALAANIAMLAACTGPTFELAKLAHEVVIPDLVSE